MVKFLSLSLFLIGPKTRTGPMKSMIGLLSTINLLSTIGLIPTMIIVGITIGLNLIGVQVNRLIADMSVMIAEMIVTRIIGLMVIQTTVKIPIPVQIAVTIIPDHTQLKESFTI